MRRGNDVDGNKQANQQANKSIPILLPISHMQTHTLEIDMQANGVLFVVVRIDCMWNAYPWIMYIKIHGIPTQNHMLFDEFRIESKCIAVIWGISSRERSESDREMGENVRKILSTECVLSHKWKAQIALWAVGTNQIKQNHNRNSHTILTYGNSWAWIYCPALSCLFDIVGGGGGVDLPSNFTIQKRDEQCAHTCNRSNPRKRKQTNKNIGYLCDGGGQRQRPRQQSFLFFFFEWKSHRSGETATL